MTTYSIYRITNLCNNKVYIGWTSRDPRIRFTEHRTGGSNLSYAIKKYGKENFTYVIIYQTHLFDHSEEMERFFIKEHNSLAESLGGWGYNIDGGGSVNKEISQETRDKLSKSKKGKPLTEEHKRNISEGIKGKTNQEYMKRLHQMNTGKSLSEETRKKISEKHKGRIFSEEHKKKLSLAAKNRKPKQLQD